MWLNRYIWAYIPRKREVGNDGDIKHASNKTAPYLRRMHREIYALERRRRKLGDFLFCGDLDGVTDAQQALMRMQYEAMCRYSMALSARIELGEIKKSCPKT